jgi:hypothetical protein
MKPDWESELEHLIRMATDGSAEAVDWSRLESLLDENPDAMAAYVELMTVHALLQWRSGSKLPTVEDGGLSDDASGLPRSADPPVLHVPPTVPFPFNLLYLTGDTPVASALLWLVMCFGAGLVIMVLAMLVVAIRGVHVTVDGGDVAKAPVVQPKKPHTPATPANEDAPGPTVARLTRMADCQWVHVKGAPALGDDLTPGQRLALKSGLAEIIFQGGAKVLLRGPADMEVASRSSAFLRHGSLTATVESPLAKGFEIHTPGMKYTDLGTEFGVLVTKDGMQEVHVFRGKVQADISGQWSVAGGQREQKEPKGPEPATPKPHASSLKPAALILVANEALRITAPDKPIERIAADQQRFIRRVDDWNHFPLFSTGTDVDANGADKHWRVVAISTQPQFVASPATVVPRQADIPFVAVCLAGNPSMPAGCLMTFRTEFDLSGFDPATAKIEGQCGADDWPVELRLNGQPIPLANNEKKSFAVVPLCLDHGFVAARNVVEIVV